MNPDLIKLYLYQKKKIICLKAFNLRIIINQTYKLKNKKFPSHQKNKTSQPHCASLE